MPVTLKAVNAELERKGIEARLQKASGYFYFEGGEASDWIDKTVNVQTVGSHSVTEWVEQFRRLQKLNRQILSGKGQSTRR